MGRICVLCIIWAAFLAAESWGQAKNLPGTDPALAEETAGTPQIPATVKPEGDIVTLVTGKQLSGVQVLRETPVYIEIEVLEGLEPLRIPRKQIKEPIIYDDIDPIARRRGRAHTPGESPEMILGEELSADFHRKLTAPLSIEPIEIEAQGFIMTLNRLGELAGVPIEVTEEARALPLDQRVRGFSIPAGTTLFSFFQSDFPKAFPALQLTYKFDKVIVSMKTSEEGNNTSTVEAPPS